MIVINHDAPGWVAELAFSELSALVPGILRIDVSTTGRHIDMGPSGNDMMYLAFSLFAGEGACWDPGISEILRLTYWNVDGAAIGNDVILRVRVRGLRPSDPPPWSPGSFGGQPGYVDCMDGNHALALETWSEYGMPDNEDLARAVVLNPSWFPVDNEATSLSILKVRY